MGDVPPTIGHSLNLAFGMFWEILWGLILGFLLWPSSSRSSRAPRW